MSSIDLHLPTTTLDLSAALRRLAAASPRAAGAALRRIGEDVAGASKDLTPVDTGDLKASTFASPVEDTPQGLSVTVSAGRGLDYAIPVHENERARHVVGQAKYLETARAQETGGGLFEWKVGRYMREELRADGIDI